MAMQHGELKERNKLHWFIDNNQVEDLLAEVQASNAGEQVWLPLMKLTRIQLQSRLGGQTVSLTLGVIPLLLEPQGSSHR